MYIKRVWVAGSERELSFAVGSGAAELFDWLESLTKKLKKLEYRGPCLRGIAFGQHHTCANYYILVYGLLDKRMYNKIR